MASAASHERAASTAERKILLVGASRGLGLGLAKSFTAHGWAVVATERKAPGVGELAAAMAVAAGRIRIEHVDINDPQAVQRLHAQLTGELFDAIFIVAGISDKDPTRPLYEVPLEEAIQVFVSNAYSSICFAETFFDLLKSDGTLAIMTSRMGSLPLVSTATDGSWEVSRASKAALNMLTRCFHQRHQDGRRTILLMHPGWVKTDMGGKDAPVDLQTNFEGLYAVRALVDALFADGEIESTAVVLMHSYLSPEHEVLIKKIFAERAPNIPVWISYEELPK
jgi:NAD(P)-dependent dehydrogenase (short-subunit alcohol dehydrogenase family)